MWLINGAWTWLCAPTYTQNKFNIKMRKCKQRQTNEQHDNTLLCYGNSFSLCWSGRCAACLLVFPEVAGLCHSASVCVLLQVEDRVVRCWGHWETVYKLTPRPRGQEQRAARGWEDRTETHFCFYNLVLAVLLFSFPFSLSCCLSFFWL